MSGIQETFLPSSSFIALTMPDQLRKRAGVFLLLPLFAKQIEYRLSSQEDHGSVQRFGFARTDPCWPSFMRAPATKKRPRPKSGPPVIAGNWL